MRAYQLTGSYLCERVPSPLPILNSLNFSSHPWPESDWWRRTIKLATFRMLCLTAFVVIVMARLPMAWVQGRFYSEELTVFFDYARHFSTVESIARSFAGYLNLAANTFTLLAARLVQHEVLPLELAPYVTMTAALLFQTIPVFLILYGQAKWLEKRWAVIAALLVLAISPRTEEVFFNVLHTQFHLALAVATILVLDLPRSVRAKFAYNLILFFAPLCGPAAIILVPFFVLRGFLERSRGRLIQTAILILGSAIQLLFFFAPNPLRGNILDPATISALLLGRTVILPLTNSMLAQAFSDLTYAYWSEARVFWWFAAAGFITYFAVLVRWAMRKPDAAAVWLIVPGLTIAAISFGGGMITTNNHDFFSVGAAQRYNFIPVVLVGWGIIALVGQLEGTPRRICSYLCMFMLVSGVVSYSFPLPELSRGPAWRDEVARWRVDGAYAPRAWPRTWKVELSGRARPCSEPRLGGPPSGDPAYCESAWLERVSKPAAMTKD